MLAVRLIMKSEPNFFEVFKQRILKTANNEKK